MAPIRPKTQSNAPIEKVWLTTSELQQYLGFGSYDHFQKLRDSGELPYYQVGKIILYKRKDVDAWVEKHKVESNIDILSRFKNK